MRTILLSSLILAFGFTFIVFPQPKDLSQFDNNITLVDTSAILLNQDNNTVPLLFVSEQSYDDMNIRVLQTSSQNGERINIKYLVKKDSVFSSGKKIFTSIAIIPDESVLSGLTAGRYQVSFLIMTEKNGESLEQISFIIPASKSVFGYFESMVQWLRDNLLSFVWSIVEVVIFLVLLIIIIRFFVIIPFKGSRRSLKVLPIFNETGNKDFDGVANGIDDILMTRLQDISEIGKSDELKQYWLTDLRETTKGISQSLNIVGGEVTIDFQKLGDISIGPFKIPLGALSSIILKLFGGYYISGSIQQYGTDNKMILSLENRQALLQYKKSKQNRVKYFEANWPSEQIKQINLAEGIPEVIDQMAYRVILNLTENVGTSDWQAYKYFLEGNYLFNSFEKNRTRKDMLRDAIDKWRMSLRFDPQFAKAHYNLGVALDMDDFYPDAVFRYQKAMELSPELIGREAHYNLSKIYWDIYKDEERTLAELEKIKKIDPNLTYVYNLEGLIRLKQLNYNEALRLFKKSVELSLKPDAVLYYNLSVTHYNLNQYDEAEENGKKAIGLLPQEKVFTDLLQTMGWIYNKKGERSINANNLGQSVSEYFKAAGFFQQALKEEPEKQALLDGYGEALRETGKTKEALIIQKRLLRLWPEYSRGYFEIAKTMTMLKHSNVDISACNEVGAVLSDSNLVKDISKLKEKIEETVSGSSLLKQKLLFDMLGRFYYFLASEQQSINQKRYSEHLKFSRTYLEKAIAINTPSEYFLEAELHQVYGNVLSLYNELDKAIYELNFSLELYQLIPGFEYECAVCYYQSAKNYNMVPNFENADRCYTKSIDYYKRAGYNKIAATVHLDDAKVLMKWYWNQGDGQCYDWARKECDNAIKLDHTSYEAYHVKGNTYYDFYKYSEAIPQYEIAVELNFNSPGAHYNLGLCYKNISNYERAVKSFETVSKLDKYYADPKNENKPDPYSQLAECYKQLGRPDKALNLLKHVVNLYPSSAKYSILLGDFLTKCGQIEEAISKYESAIDIDKDHSEKILHLAQNSLANIYLDNGINFNEAERMVHESLKLSRKFGKKKSSEHCLIQNTLGWICFHKNQFNRAVMLMEKTLPVLVNDQKAHARLALAYEKYSELSNDTVVKKQTMEKAIEHWQIVKSLGSSTKFGLMAEKRFEK